MIEVKQASMVENSNEYLADIFVEGFYNWLYFFSKDKAKLKRAFKHIFILDKFYVGIQTGKVVGMTAVSDGKSLVVKLNKKELTKNLGFIKGRLAYIVLRKEFETIGKHDLPMLPEIAFVSVLKEYRRQGVAETIINHIIKLNLYDKYLLEVADNNTSAIKLYEKLGFIEYQRIPVKNAKQAGFENYLYMIRDK